MLLVVTTRDDPTTDSVIAELRRRDAPFLRFNTEDYPGAVSLIWTDDGETTLDVAGRKYSTDEFDAVWYRRPVPPVMPAAFDADLRAWATDEAAEALDGVWRGLRARWVNHPHADAWAGCKPAQLRTAKQLGFSVPSTLVTNDPTAAANFVNGHEQVICKPIYNGLVTRANTEQLFWTMHLETKALTFDDFGPEPYLLQAEIAKAADVRVTVVGERVFAVAIRTPVGAPTDWRRTSLDQLRHDIIELPEDIEALCRALAQTYELRFAAIDLALTCDDRFDFLELNPNGQWAWLEDETGVPLCAAMVDLLLGADG